MTQTSPAAGIDTAFATDFAQRWLDAWNSHEPQRLLDLMTDDIEYDDSAWPTTMHGHAEVRAFLEHTWRAFPDMRFELADAPFVQPDAARAAYRWRGYATHTGRIDPPGLNATDRRIEMEGVDFHEYRDGKVMRLAIIFDMAAALRQLGSLPEPGSRAERLMARLGNLQTKLRR